MSDRRSIRIRRQRNRFRPRLNDLEARALLTTAGLANRVLTVLGTDGADRINVSFSQQTGKLTVREHGNVVGSFKAADVDRLDVSGRGGNDLIDLDSVKVASVLRGGDGDDRIYGGQGNDYIIGDSGDDALHGEDGHDVLVGGAGADDLYGGDGKDQLAGNDGNDVLYGGDGDDKLYGGDGHDRLDGGDKDSGGTTDGSDTLDGGPDADDLNFGDKRTGPYQSGDHDTLIGATSADTVYFKAYNQGLPTLRLLDGTDGQPVRDIKLRPGVKIYDGTGSRVLGQVGSNGARLNAVSDDGGQRSGINYGARKTMTVDGKREPFVYAWNVPSAQGRRSGWVREAGLADVSQTASMPTVRMLVPPAGDQDNVDRYRFTRQTGRALQDTFHLGRIEGDAFHFYSFGNGSPGVAGHYLVNQVNADDWAAVLAYETPGIGSKGGGVARDIVPEGTTFYRVRSVATATVDIYNDSGSGDPVSKMSFLYGYVDIQGERRFGWVARAALD